MRAKVLGSAAGLALALAASAPAEAQLFPVIAVPPPMAQGIVTAKPLKPASTNPNPPAVAQLPSPEDSQCHLSGRLRICH
jgi:hypothetical protein